MTVMYLRYDPDAPVRKVFRCYFYFIGWWALLNLGVHLDLTRPNFELHLPTGVFKCGWYEEPIMEDE